MAAPTNYYVDPTINGNSGSGTIGDPYGDLQYALNTITRDATNGDQINIKSGTAEVLAASLTLATYGTPSATVPLILRGYTSTAGDGGRATIDANGAPLLASAYVMRFADLVMHNFGNNNGITCGAQSYFYNCGVHKGASSPSGKILVTCGNRSYMVGCNIYNSGTSGNGVFFDGASFIYGSYFYNHPGYGIRLSGYSKISNCIFVDCPTRGIYITGAECLVDSNTIYSSTAATGKGIENVSTGNVIINNIIEGYSGTGGIGLYSSADVELWGYNSFYNCATNKSTVDVYVDLSANDVALSASPFTNAAGGDFSLNKAVTGCIENAFPGAWYGPSSTTNKMDRGAVQNGAGAAGALLINPGLSGGLR